MILILTEQADLTADLVAQELGRRGTTFARCNTDRLLSDTSLSFEMPSAEATLIDELSERFDLNSVTSIWYRRPSPAVTPPGLDTKYSAFVQRETWSQALGMLYGLDAKWMNRPDANARANHKLFQLRVANSLGLRVPATIVTRDPNLAQSFLRTAPSNVIAKPLSHGMLEFAEGELAIHTHRVSDSSLRGLDLVRWAPVLFQHEIEKAFDYRVTVVGRNCISVRIDSQSASSSVTDWRLGENLPHTVVNLPSDLTNKLLRFCHLLDLPFAAIDLVESKTGEFFFLEVNPNGQWGWLELATNAKISAEIANWLTNPHD